MRDAELGAPHWADRVGLPTAGGLTPAQRSSMRMGGLEPMKVWSGAQVVALGLVQGATEAEEIIATTVGHRRCTALSDHSGG